MDVNPCYYGDNSVQVRICIFEFLWDEKHKAMRGMSIPARPNLPHKDEIYYISSL